MTVAEHPREPTEGEARWASPLYAFVAWLAALLGHITRLKRIRHTQKFKPGWCESWQDLRQAEWLRDQVIAHGVASLLEGKDLNLDPTLIMDPPADYGGPAPRTPFDMNRRFLALARFAADPEAIVRRRHQRLVTRLKLDPTNPLAAHGSTDALRAAHHEAAGVARVSTRAAGGAALMVNSDRRERPSNHEGGLANARAPPLIPIMRNPLPQRPRA